MKYNKIILSLLIIVFFAKLSFSQTAHSYKEQIIWTKKVKLQEGEQQNNSNIYYFEFEGSVRLSNNNFPFYAKIINLKELSYGGGKIEISLSNMIFKPVTDNEKSGVRNIDKIANKIEIEHKISFGQRTPYLEYNFVPMRKNSSTGKIEKLISFSVSIKETTQKANNSSQKSKDFATSSVLSTGKWVKIGIIETGIHKITDTQLSNLGFTNPANVRVFGNDQGMLPFMNSETYIDDLVENDIYRGSDHILFYAKAATVWDYDEENEMFLHRLHLYSDTTYYFLTDKNTGNNNTISQENQASGTNNLSVTSYDYYTYYESEELNLLNSGRIWLGESFNVNSSQRFSFDMPNLVSNSEMKLYVSLVARSSISSSFTIRSTNINKTVSIKSTNDNSHGSFYAHSSYNFYTYNAPSSDKISLSIDYNKPTSSADGWLDHIVYNAKCALSLNNGVLLFRNASTAGTDNITKFNLSGASSSTIVWDVTTPYAPKKINSTISGSSLNFKVETPEIKEFVAFDGTNYLTPVLEGKGIGDIANQNLHGINSNVEMIIVTHPDFLEQAEEISQIHAEHDGIVCYIATVDEVYNEFSCGTNDVSAIRNFMKLAYWKENSKLKYLMLLGDGSYKNKDQSELNSNYILTYQTEHSFTKVNTMLTTVSDDYFVLLDDEEGELEGSLDLGVGRMPVKNHNSKNEAIDMVNKIRAYINPDNMGDWKNVLCFVGDDEDSNGHMDDAEELSNNLDTLYPAFIFKKIYLDAYPQESAAVGDEYPLAVVELNNRINKGALIVNYSGHGSVNTLAHERLVTVSDINNWNNLEHLSLFFTGTCEFSRFDNYSQEEKKTSTSAGEYVFLNPNGGAIAMFTTARVSYSHSNFMLNQNAYKFIFEDDENNNRYKFGDIYRLAKNTTSGPNMRYFALFGDPALELAYAKEEVITSTINGVNTKTIDTLNALELITITGEMQNRLSGEKLTSFNGMIYPTVLDKNKQFKTLGNEEAGPFDYLYQNNVLFKGRVTVRNGEFSFSFIVPKDIYYNYGYGKISYYAKSSTTDARGYFKNFIIGGSNENVAEDNIGPVIKLYMNDSTFIEGGMTNQNPLIYSKLSDESGINTAGSGIGHDISAIIDKNTSQMFVLNDYYEAELDSYQKGTVEYGLFKLDDGEHTLTLKAWDVYNNSSEEEISFMVMEASEFKINRLYNYPNPFTTNTSFYFEHNQPNSELDVLLQIFTVSGKVVKTIHTQMFTSGFMSDPVEWNGTDDFESNIGRGVYIYRLKITTPTGKNVEKYEKLLILK